MAPVRPARDPRVEERKAREKQRAMERFQRAAAKKREREAREKRVRVIREELARSRAKRCQCGITTRTTYAQLRELGAGCTAERWVCPVLDAIRRRLER